MSSQNMNRSRKISRKKFIRYGLESAAAAGSVGIASALAGETSLPRPPGAADDFYRKCIRCGACVEVCPEHALKQMDMFPDFFNLGSPVLDYKKSGCAAWGKKPGTGIPEKPECSACMEVCPSGALDIRRFKSIGKAIIRPDKCVNCMECFKVCPVRGAVLFPNPEGKPFVSHTDIPVKLGYENSKLKPYIDSSLCTGCGRCAAICPPRVIEIKAENI